jgi:hypothetical protein
MKPGPHLFSADIDFAFSPGGLIILADNLILFRLGLVFQLIIPMLGRNYNTSLNSPPTTRSSEALPTFSNNYIDPYGHPQRTLG